MANDNNRHVVPGANGGWDVVRPGGDRASAHLDKQSDAINRARDIVTNLGGGEVRIHNRQGQIRDTDTVGGGHDPNPPKDRK